MSGYDISDGRSGLAADLLKDSTDILNQLLEFRFRFAGSGQNSYPPGGFETITTEPDSFAKTAFDSIALSGGAALSRNKNALLVLLGRLPDQGKKIGRKSLSQPE